MSKSTAIRSLLSIPQLVAHVQSPLYRNGYALILSDGTTAALGLLYWVLAARYYAVEIVGQNAALISALLLLSGISQLNLSAALIRFVPVAGRVTARFVARAYLVSLSLAVLVSLGLALGPEAWFPAQRLLGASPAVRVWFILATMAWSIFTLQDNVLTGLGQAIWVPFENILFAVAKIILLLLFAHTFHAFGIFASWTIPVAASLIPMNMLIFRRLIPRHIQATHDHAQPIVPRQIIKFVTGNYLGSLFGLMPATLFPLLVIQLVGPSANAYFYPPWIMLNALQLMAFNMMTSLTVEAARDQTKLAEYAYRVLIHSARLLVPVVVVILVGAPLILTVFGAGYAAEGATLLRLFALSTIPNIVVVLYISYARVRNRVVGIVTVQASLAGLAFGLSSVLLPRYGVTSIGWAWLISQLFVALLLTVLHTRFLRRTTRIMLS